MNDFLKKLLLKNHTVGVIVAAIAMSLDIRAIYSLEELNLKKDV